jgi:hypothetical protein
MPYTRAVLRTLVLAALAAAIVAAPADAAGWRLGVVADGPFTDSGWPIDAQAEWDLLAATGATEVRTAFYWSLAQPTGPGPVSFAATDPVVLAAAKRRLRVLPVVLGTPGWARIRQSPRGAKLGRASPPRETKDFGAFLRALVRRYGPRGSFWQEHPELPAQPIRDWQIWNEPNLPGFWSVQPFARRYVRTLRDARRALRREDPGARAILAGLPRRTWEELQLIYRAGGRRHFDAVAVHPYTARPRDVVRIVALVRSVMRRNGDRRLPIWVTELSWPAAPGIGFGTTNRGQANRLREGIGQLRAARRRLRIERVYWYTWLSDEKSTSAFGRSGLRRLRADGRVVDAPALAEFRRAARLGTSG